MKENVFIMDTDGKIIESEYCEDINKCFSNIPEFANPIIKQAKDNFKKIEKMLYTMPSFIELIKASVPEQAFSAILNETQKNQLAKGTVKLMTKKNGKIMANLVNTKTGKIVSTVDLKKINISSEMSQAITSYTTQMQLAQIAEEIQKVQIAVEEVREGQEFDRLSTAYSCQQKLLQAMQIKNTNLKEMALLKIVSDAEDSRNLLMLSQKSNLNYISQQPESFIQKFINGASQGKIKQRLDEIREGLNSINMVSLVELIAYQEMGENLAGRQSLNYYANFIDETYLKQKSLVEKLDLIDPLPNNDWSKFIPELKQRILELPTENKKNITEGASEIND